MGNRIQRIIFVLIIGSISLALNVVATVHDFSPFKIVGLVRFSEPLVEDCSHDESPIRHSFGLKQEQLLTVVYPTFKQAGFNDD